MMEGRIEMLVDGRDVLEEGGVKMVESGEVRLFVVGFVVPIPIFKHF